jgi:hypothetical protein
MNLDLCISKNETQQTMKASNHRNLQRKSAASYPAMCIDIGK